MGWLACKKGLVLGGAGPFCVPGMGDDFGGGGADAKGRGDGERGEAGKAPYCSEAVGEIGGGAGIEAGIGTGFGAALGAGIDIGRGFG